MKLNALEDEIPYTFEVITVHQTTLQFVFFKETLQNYMNEFDHAGYFGISVWVAFKRSNMYA